MTTALGGIVKEIDNVNDKIFSHPKYDTYPEFIKTQINSTEQQVRNTIRQKLNVAPVYYKVPYTDVAGTEPDRYEKLTNYKEILKRYSENRDNFPLPGNDDLDQLANVMNDNIGVNNLYGKAALAHIEKKFRSLELDDFRQFIFNAKIDYADNKFILDKIDELYPEEYLKRKQWVDENIDKYKKLSKMFIYNTTPNDREEFMILYALADEDFRNTVNFNTIKTFTDTRPIDGDARNKGTLRNNIVERDYTRDLMNLRPGERGLFENYNAINEISTMIRDGRVNLAFPRLIRNLDPRNQLRYGTRPKNDTYYGNIARGNKDFVRTEGVFDRNIR